MEEALAPGAVIAAVADRDGGRQCDLCLQRASSRRSALTYLL